MWMFVRFRSCNITVVLFSVRMRWWGEVAEVCYPDSYSEFVLFRLYFEKWLWPFGHSMSIILSVLFDFILYVPVTIFQL